MCVCVCVCGTDEIPAARVYVCVCLSQQQQGGETRKLNRAQNADTYSKIQYGDRVALANF